MDLPGTLQYLLNEVTAIQIPNEEPEDYTDDSSNTVLIIEDDGTLDKQYEDTMNALQAYLDPILVEEIGGNSLSSGADVWCLMPGYPDPMQLHYYNTVTGYLSALMQTAKGVRPVDRLLYTEENIDRAYYALQQLNASDSMVELYNDCLNSLLSVHNNTVSNG